MIEKKLQQFEILEVQYRERLNNLIEEYIGANESCHKLNFESSIIACNDGLFITRTGTKNGADFLITNQFQGDAMHAREVFKWNKLEHCRIVNKTKFYSLDFFNYDQIAEYNPITTADEDFKMIVSNENLVDDHYIRTVDDAIDLGVFSGFERGQFIFRGQVNAEWDLTPKLFRDFPKDANIIEIALFKRMLMGIKNPYSNTYDPLEQMMNFQHFGVPTRLLDWTSDILIALFFACYDPKNEHNEKDGKIFITHRYQFKQYRLNDSGNSLLRKPMSEATKDLFMKRIEIDDIQILEPVIKNPRLRVQDGCFMFFPFLPLNSDDQKYVTLIEYLRAKNSKIKEESSNDAKEVWLGFVKIDKNFKKSILQELENHYGISQTSLSLGFDHINLVEKYYTNLYKEAKKTTKVIRGINN